uniref:Transmembrane protein 19 n=1 Tax=Timema shepardi TaxID=629360 RepID=A0A7R9AYA3_TIMSH|nr:unnamed protein product [Timema shepardi]
MKTSKSRWAAPLPILICTVAIPLSMLMWLGNLAFSFFTHGDSSRVYEGLLVGFVLCISNFAFVSCLFTFFVTSSRATKFRSGVKRGFEEEFKEGGQRNWLQVLCNSGMAMQLALLYLLDVGCEERPIDFTRDYRSSWLGIGVLGEFDRLIGVYLERVGEQLALLCLIHVSRGESPLDFTRDYRSSWLGIGVLGEFNRLIGAYLERVAEQLALLCLIYMVAEQLALLCLIHVSRGELPLDVTRDYRSSWLGIGVLGEFNRLIGVYLERVGEQLALLCLVYVSRGESPLDVTRDYRSSWLGIGVLGEFNRLIGVYLERVAEQLALLCLIYICEPRRITTRRHPGLQVFLACLTSPGTTGLLGVLGEFDRLIGVYLERVAEQLALL